MKTLMILKVIHGQFGGTFTASLVEFATASLVEIPLVESYSLPVVVSRELWKTHQDTKPLAMLAA